MPINVKTGLPAIDILSKEGVVVMTEDRATHQDIRPLRIAILNIMPTKMETQLLRLLGNSPLQIEITLLRMATHESKNTSAEHLNMFYTTPADVKKQKFDGLIITGAPVETIPFEEVNYWQELVELMEFSKRNVFSVLHICWGAQAALFHHYGINKILLDNKMFGVFEHDVCDKKHPIMRGFDDMFFVPHSRHTDIDSDAVYANDEITVVSKSSDAGLCIMSAKDSRQIFITGHLEYDPHTLKGEYDRDVSRGLPIHIPANYYKNNDPTCEPVVKWRAHANLLFRNWTNFVYQQTPFNLDTLTSIE